MRSAALGTSVATSPAWSSCAGTFRSSPILRGRSRACMRSWAGRRALPWSRSRIRVENATAIRTAGPVGCSIPRQPAPSGDHAFALGCGSDAKTQDATQQARAHPKRPWSREPKQLVEKDMAPGPSLPGSFMEIVAGAARPRSPAVGLGRSSHQTVPTGAGTAARFRPTGRPPVMERPLRPSGARDQ